MEAQKFSFANLALELPVKIGYFEEFKARAQKITGKNYEGMFSNLPTLPELPEFSHFIESCKQAEKAFPDRDFLFSDDSQAMTFYRSLLTDMLCNEKSLLDLHVHFETSVSLLKKNHVLDQIKWPKILLIVSRMRSRWNGHELIEEDEKNITTYYRLFESMGTYMWGKEKPPTQFLGVILTLHGPKIAWFQNFSPERTLTLEQLSVYEFDWTSLSLSNFSKDIDENVLHKMPPPRVENISKLYIFLDFVCSFIKTAYSLGKKDEEEKVGLKIDSQEDRELEDQSDNEFMALGGRGIMPDFKKAVEKIIEAQKKKACLSEVFQIYDFDPISCQELFKEDKKFV